MSRRAGFVLDATSMGLSPQRRDSNEPQPSNRRGAIESNQNQNQNQNQNTNPNPRRASFNLDHSPMPRRASTGEVTQSSQVGDRRSPMSTGLRSSQSPGASSGERPSTSTLFTPHSEIQLQNQLAAAAGANRTTHAQCNASTEAISTDYYRCRLKDLRETSGICGDAARMNFELNYIFLNRLDEIDCLDKQCGGDSLNMTLQLRLITFQEWVDLLLHVNNIIFGNMSALEEEAYAKIMTCFQSVRGEQQQALEENRKLRRDICAIIKLVQNAYHKNSWNTDDICLETLTINQLLGISRDQCRPESESEKVAKCMKSLANEVAAKHDECCHLQSQLCALDEVVQTARQKLLMKDQCIAQLNKQLMELQNCLDNMTQHNTKEKPESSATSDPCSQNENQKPKVCSSEVENEKISNCMYENLVQGEQQECEMLRLLDDELNEVLDLHNQRKFEAMDCHKQRLSCIFKKMDTEREEMRSTLEKIRSQLHELECDVDLTAPKASSTKVCNDDPDSKMIEALRRRLSTLNNCNKELHCKFQRLETQNNELKSKYDLDHCINKKNCDVLKEIADLICKLRSADFSYDDLYCETPKENPFCVAIMEMYEKCEMQQNNNEQDELIECQPNRSDIESSKTTTTTTIVAHIETPTTKTTTPK